MADGEGRKWVGMSGNEWDGKLGEETDQWSVGGLVDGLVDGLVVC
jgi:hypothetical protein